MLSKIKKWLRATVLGVDAEIERLGDAAEARVKQMEAYAGILIRSWNTRLREAEAQVKDLKAEIERLKERVG